MHRFTLLYAFVAFLSISGIIDALPTGKREPKAPLAGASHLSRTQPLPRLVALSRYARSVVPQSSDLLLAKRSTRTSKPGGFGGISVPSVSGPSVSQTKPKKKKKPTTSKETKSDEDKKDDDVEKDGDEKKDEDEKKDDEGDGEKKNDGEEGDEKKEGEDTEDKPKKKEKKPKPLTKAERQKLKEQKEAEAKKQAEEKKKQEDEENEEKERKKEEKRLKAKKAKEEKEQAERDKELKEQKEKAAAAEKEAKEKREAVKAKVNVPQNVQAKCGGSRVHKTAKLVEGITDALLRLDTLKKTPGNQVSKEQPKAFGGFDEVPNTGGKNIRSQFTKCDTTKMREWPIVSGGNIKDRFDPDRSPPGTDRVIFDEDGQYCGIVSHPPSKGSNNNSFVICEGGK
ncbi:hypothetical protein DL96DRAFT_1677697 [Flagelloscypha sp. PMI_526]|nr:hypothetical protein DL96DRAFT_1677697 [Flagelloscypha sp. PMI_526]